MARFPRRRPALPLRAVPPNAITVLALCSGLTGVRFAIDADWEKAVASIAVAAILDGLDGRVARLLKGASRFGAELDSLSDAIAFGVSPAIILYLWSLQYVPKYGWVIALTQAVCCALRLARFNANLDSDEQPRKMAGYFTGVPAPAGAALALLPVALWLATGLDVFTRSYSVAPWTIIVALLMISDLATYSWSSFRLRLEYRIPALLLIALLGTALITSPWATFSVCGILYTAMIPLASRSYARIRRRRAAEERPPAS